MKPTNMNRMMTITRGRLAAGKMTRTDFHNFWMRVYSYHNGLVLIDVLTAPLPSILRKRGIVA